MPITQQQINKAEVNQNSAAFDSNPQVRLIAGPGTGKSSVIEKRILWLLQNGTLPSNIFAISFTRASSQDLMKRVKKYCEDHGRPEGRNVSITTLHSLALRTLSMAGLLTYPGTPSILDDWELKNIIDSEFSVHSGYTSGNPINGYPPRRCEDIRRDFEAFCGTGQWNPVNFIPPTPPISPQERQNYQTFHLSRTKIYSCLLPGEIVQKCLEYMRANTLHPENLLNIHYLIVDEYQDLNPLDIEFIDRLTQNGVNTFVAGDDDQSIYSFRFASPSGIQLYHQRFAGASDHSLHDCFRCTPFISNSARTLINHYGGQHRIPKNISSLYENSVPPVNGTVYLWHFKRGNQESRAIAQSISSLINRGIDPKQIMILLANSKIQLQPITSELDGLNILYESPREESFFDKKAGRFVIGLLRLACHTDDYFAYRLILGSRPNIGPTSCNNIAELVETNNLNYQDIFRNPIPNGVFSTRLINIINDVRNICNLISSWQPDNLLSCRVAEITQIIQNIFGQVEVQEWQNKIAQLPQATTLKELLDYILTDNSEQRENILKDIYSRLQIPYTGQQGNDQKIQIMTMHGAKGLSARIVFIPGLEQQILPGLKRIHYQGLIFEAARMLYVSITRARASCIISFADNRYYFGKNYRQTPSDFTSFLNGVFSNRTQGLTDNELDEIVQDCANL
ncbi:MAG TPA: ATP-dependent helicase [Anaerolineaceae bacterium]|nr:ATP-dependent helicase [Anaerolineaceae bacterium]